MKPKTPSTPTQDKMYNYLDVSPTVSTVHSTSSLLLSSVQSNKKEALELKLPSRLLKPRDATKRSLHPLKPQISILERHDYEKGPSRPKLIKIDNKPSTIASSISAISASNKTLPPSSAAHTKKSDVPIKQTETFDSNKELNQLKVIVAQEVESPVVKQEHEINSPIKPMTPSEQKDPQNINKINNKINIIFQLNDNTKSLRKNIILHRRAPKKMVQKITIKEANNNTKIQQEDTVFVPEKVLCSVDTQTETFNDRDIVLSTTNPLCDEYCEHLFFEDDVLISLQQATISFFEYNRLESLLKKGETYFKLIDRIPRRLHDKLIDPDNKFQRLCFNDQNSLPIYVEMRAKQKELDDPEMCPIAFLYCNVYYIDQRRAKFSSVHLDTVKSVIDDIIYTTVPGTSYFIMAWNEKTLDTKSLFTGIVKYKLTPNLDLAKLASIRQFPKLNYRTKQMNCGKG